MSDKYIVYISPQLAESLARFKFGLAAIEQTEAQERFKEYRPIIREGVQTNCKYNPNGRAEAHGIEGPCNCGGVAERDRIHLYNKE